MRSYGLCREPGMEVPQRLRRKNSGLEFSGS
jgi:hypothetical protein